jgi:hypothetical protein
VLGLFLDASNAALSLFLLVMVIYWKSVADPRAVMPERHCCEQRHVKKMTTSTTTQTQTIQQWSFYSRDGIHVGIWCCRFRFESIGT